uniref:DUF234 domain-containing protein n=1 Tax=Candidatus Caldatribacterium californiense TaxID=1454726 RepID=A0A7V3YLN4_9BACT
MLAKRLGLEESVAEAKDFEVDGCLLRFEKPEVALEVKWREKLADTEVRKIAERLERFGARRKMIFVPERGG